MGQLLDTQSYIEVLPMGRLADTCSQGLKISCCFFKKPPVTTNKRTLDQWATVVTQ